jgi:hypothetical protein
VHEWQCGQPAPWKAPAGRFVPGIQRVPVSVVPLPTAEVPVGRVLDVPDAPLPEVPIVPEAEVPVELDPALLPSLAPVVMSPAGATPALLLLLPIELQAAWLRAMTPPSSMP